MEEFFKLFEELGPYEERPEIAVAISGGADSLALTLSINDWIKGRGGIVYGLTIDHQLRQESAEEAETVGKWLKCYNIQHFIMKANISQEGNLAAKARSERYKLLTEWCKKSKILHLFIAHNLDDQAENLVIRAIRGSGIDGLSHIKHISYHNGVRILRPFLSVSKESIKAFLIEKSQNWVEDPTNINQEYLRPRVRSFLNSNYLEESGLIKKRFKDVSFHLSEANKIIHNLVYDFIAKEVSISNSSYIRVNYNSFLKLEKVIALKVIANLLTIVGKLQYPPRLKSLNNLYQLLADKESSGPNTFCHTKIVKNLKQDCFCLAEE